MQVVDKESSSTSWDGAGRQENATARCKQKDIVKKDKQHKLCIYDGTEDVDANAGQTNQISQ